MILIDELDESGKPTGNGFPKNVIHEQGMWHNAAHVWIFNNNGDILMQLRAKGKDSYPECWDISAAGHIDSGEEPLEGAVRELDEELGLVASPNDFKLVFTEKISNFIKEINWQNNEFDYVYLLRHNEDIGELKLQPKEVEKVEFISKEEFVQFFGNREGCKRKLIPGTEEYYKKVWDAIEKELKNKNDFKNS